MAGAQSQAMLEKMELRQSYRNVWHTDLTNAVAADLPCAYPTSLRTSSPFSFGRLAFWLWLWLWSRVIEELMRDFLPLLLCRVLPVAVVVSGSSFSDFSTSG